ncbi:MAG: hypothetical protein B7Z43_08660 [Sphingomonas sp. 12-62-6]|nr:MAG: hypothetical protein B7Z43_08660 [Sphingomonas sp. 12-62-6]
MALEKEKRRAAAPKADPKVEADVAVERPARTPRPPREAAVPKPARPARAPAPVQSDDGPDDGGWNGPLPDFLRATIS